MVQQPKNAFDLVNAIQNGLIQQSDITLIGEVNNRSKSGRTSEDEITLFDGTGVGLQDLAIASATADSAEAKDQVNYIHL